MLFCNFKTEFSFSLGIVATHNLIINIIYFKVPRSVRMMFIYPRILAISHSISFFLCSPISIVYYPHIIVYS